MHKGWRELPQLEELQISGAHIDEDPDLKAMLDQATDEIGDCWGNIQDGLRDAWDGIKSNLGKSRVPKDPRALNTNKAHRRRINKLAKKARRK